MDMNRVDIGDYLATVSRLPGLSGNEEAVARYVADQFKPFCDEVYIDVMYNVIAHKKGTGPKVMLAAHMDEIGMMVARIEDDGCLRMKNVGGVDARILPGMQVLVYGREVLFGTIGAKPPHLLSAADRKVNYKREDLFVDLGYPADKVRELVRVGDLIAFNTPATNLKNDRLACKSMDDRACVGILLLAAERLMSLRPTADIYFVATTQEEVGSRGALAAAYDLDPDLAVALDVCHATIPGSRPDTTGDIDKLSVTKGPFMQKRLVQRLLDTAKAHNVKVQTEIAPDHTWTDADEILLSRAGVPSILLSLPLRYMHTTVETIDINVLKEGSRLLAHFLAELDESWEEDLWT